MVHIITLQQQLFEQSIKTTKTNQSYKDTNSLPRHKSKLSHYKIMHDISSLPKI